MLKDLGSVQVPYDKHLTNFLPAISFGLRMDVTSLSRETVGGIYDPSPYLTTATAMGKSQKKRAMRRHNPMRVPDSHLPQGLASAESASTKKEAILPIIHKVCFLPNCLFISFTKRG